MKFLKNSLYILIITFSQDFYCHDLDGVSSANELKSRSGKGDQFTRNQKRFIEKYDLSGKGIITFKDCKLFGVERDIISNINYYLFKDEEDIEFVVFEYSKVGMSDTIYNLSSQDIDRYIFNIDITVPKWVELVDVDSFEPYLIENNFLTRNLASNRQLVSIPAYLLVKSIEKKLTVLPSKDTENKNYINVQNRQPVKIKSYGKTKENLNNAYPNTTIEQRNLRLISIEKIANSKLILYTFYKNVTDVPSNTKGSFIYVLNYNDSEQEKYKFDIITDQTKLFNLQLSPANFILLDQFGIYLFGYCYKFSSGRSIGGEKYPTYFLKQVSVDPEKE